MNINIRNRLCLYSLTLALGVTSVGCGHGGPEDLEIDEAAAQCGLTQDFQDVELYDGTLGISKDFVAKFESRVGQIQWNNSLATNFTNGGALSGVRWCSGTLISANMFLTAGHCFDVDAGRLANGNWPLDGSGNPISGNQAALQMRVNFDYQFDDTGAAKTQTSYNIVSLLEWNSGGLEVYFFIKNGLFENHY